MKNLLLLLCLIPVTLSAQVVITDKLPDPFSLTSTPETDIFVQFDAAMDTASVNTNSFQVFGRWSGPMTGELTWNSELTEVTFTADRAFFSGEWVSVNLTHDILNQNGDALESGYGFSFWIRTLAGYLDMPETQIIEMRLPGEVFIQCYGAYAGDMNNDESSDLVVVNEDSEDLRILLNDGNGNYPDPFELIDMPGSTKPSTNEGADFDLDGEIDLAAGSTQGPEVSVFFGDGSGSLGPETVYTASLGVRGLTVLDMNADGYADIVTASRNGDDIGFFENNGDGTFADPTFMDTGSTGETSAAAGDFNNDGIMDIAIATYTGSEIFILIGDGQGNFEVGQGHSVNSNPWMIGIGDVNGDGNLDIASANAGGANVSIQLGDGLGGLGAPTYYSTGDFPLAIDLGDLDGDGDLDFVSSNYFDVTFTLYENMGDGTYLNPRTYEAYGAGSCAIFHDRNNDGIMDMTGVDEIDDLVILYDNSPVTDVHQISDPFRFEVWPNPARDFIEIQGEPGSSVNIEIISMDGRTVAVYPNEHLPARLNISHIAPQACVINLSYKNEYHSKMLVIK